MDSLKPTSSPAGTAIESQKGNATGPTSGRPVFPARRAAGHGTTFLIANRALNLSVAAALFAAAIAWGRSVPAHAAPIVVSPGGPAGALESAVEQSRKVAAGQERRIVLRAGRYALDRPLVLDARDEGLTIEGDGKGAAVLCGGRPVAGWKADGGGFYSAAVPEAATGKWDFRILVVNGRLAPRARWPEEGYLEHETSFNVPWMSTTGGGWKRKPTAEELTTMRFRAGDLGDWLVVKNAELTVYHMWDESVVGVAGIDLGERRIRFSNPAGHPPGAFGVKKYVVWNVRKGMTRPGQWYLDREAGKVVYWPLPGEDMSQAEAVAPTMESILRIAGTPEKPTRRITIKGLTLTVTNTPLRAGGFGAGHFDGAVSIRHAADCRLEGLEVTRVGGQAIKAWKVAGLRVENCHLHDCGACGLQFHDGDGLVANNHVHHVGRVYPSAIAVSLGGKGGKGIQALHNEIHDTPYSALTCGGDDHRIEGNLIYGAMQELADGAAIYITFCKRITVRGNFVRDVHQAGGYGSSAYYLDEQAEDCLVEGNLSLRVGTPSHNHMARKNTLRNNVFITDGDARITFPRSSDYRLENNVIWAKGKLVVTNPKGIGLARGNVVYTGAGKAEGVELADYRQAGTSSLDTSEGWLLADPKLAEFEQGLVRFAPGSPAVKLGIRPIDVRSAGRKPVPKP